MYDGITTGGIERHRIATIEGTPVGEAGISMVHITTARYWLISVYNAEQTLNDEVDPIRLVGYGVAEA